MGSTRLSNLARRGPNLAVNEIGSYKGDVPALKGPSVVTVTSDGVWTIRGGS
ncbi:hypothetical protein [Luteimicrobium sp. DT211]|uniref:hypothetical protein n=1 Tax=Luteimicrobium sp. DT211 TaxID=3393412 RepID=UPI003CEA91A7